MALPEAVQRQIEESKRLQEELIARTQDDTPPEPAPEPEPTPDPEPEPEPIAAPEPTPEPEPVPEPDNVDWQDAARKAEHKFKTLQGMYKADLARETQRIRDELAAEMKRQAPPAPEPGPKPQGRDATLSRIAETYGDDLADTLAEWQASREQQLLERFKPIEEQVKTIHNVQAQSAEERFLSGLDANAQGWRDLNTDDRFNDWLDATPVPFTSMTVRQALEQAAGSFDTAKVAEIFNTYTTKQNKAPAPPPVKPKPTPDIAPSRSRAATPPPSDTPTAKIWTGAEIEATYRKHNYQLPAEVKAEIDRAIAERRVR